MTTTTFDPAAFKTTTREQWQDAADAWHRWGGFVGDWLHEATETMFDLAGLAPGGQVLDIAAGAGEQSLRAARRVGPSGRVLATDIAPELLRRCAQDAAREGLGQVEVLELDGEATDTLPAGTFDAALSRVGLIYFPDRAAALRGAHHALRDGGRFAAVVYSTPEANEFFSVPVRIIRARAGLPAPGPGLPGPFSLGGPGVLADALASAGFEDVEVRTVPSPVRLASAQECVRFQQESFGALHQMMRGLDATERDDVWGEVTRALTAFEGPGGFTGPCEMLVGAGTARH
ncbi:class I SAM-dependent methyltransferase [uncultured Phycicoccus sp.]|uniref:class I SAM-dependent methyltransferase n=1 Tax=uncultured Phycicoccus sp. TaxID=661422 RepID=UPI0026199AB0|nr:class I SAM-dependent methyltransferase [uncultured Phycicoccus sp.]